MNRTLQYAEFGPPVYFGLMAFYCFVSYWLNAYPSSQFLWGVFIELTPMMREPIFLIEKYASLTLMQIMPIVVFLALLGSLALDKNRRFFRFFYFHGALLLALYSMFRERSHRTITALINNDFYNIPGTAGLREIINSKVEFNNFGLFLFSMIMIACLIWHYQSIARIIKSSR